MLFDCQLWNEKWREYYSYGSGQSGFEMKKSSFFIKTLTAVAICSILNTGPSSAQSTFSKTYNDQGCASVMAHDYELAEQEFSQAYQRAKKERNLKRMFTVLQNLETVCSLMAKPEQAKKYEAERRKLQAQQNQITYSKTPPTNQTPHMASFSMPHYGGDIPLAAGHSFASLDSSETNTNAHSTIFPVRSAPMSSPSSVPTATAPLCYDYGNPNDSQHKRTSQLAPTIHEVMRDTKSIYDTPSGFGKHNVPVTPVQYVDGYTTDSGTTVNGYNRTIADGDRANNFSTAGNVNPYTNEPGYVQP